LIFAIAPSANSASLATVHKGSRNDMFVFSLRFASLRVIPGDRYNLYLAFFESISSIKGREDPEYSDHFGQNKTMLDQYPQGNQRDRRH